MTKGVCLWSASYALAANGKIRTGSLRSWNTVNFHVQSKISIADESICS